MTNLMTTTGNLVDLKYQKTTGCLRVVIDIEPELANAAHERLGGYPNPKENRMVAIAVLTSSVYEKISDKNGQMPPIPENLRRQPTENENA